MTRVVFAAGAAAMLMAPSGSSTSAGPPPNDFRLVLDQRIGPYRYLEALNGGRSYRAAIAAFGRASARGTDGNLCTVRWRKIGLEVGFASTLKPCAIGNLKKSAWYGATVYTRRWATDRGLRVGDTATRLRSLYPRARFRDRPPEAPTWSLVRRRDQELNFELLSATVWDGHIRSIRLGPGYIY